LRDIRNPLRPALEAGPRSGGGGGRYRSFEEHVLAQPFRPSGPGREAPPSEFGALFRTPLGKTQKPPARSALYGLSKPGYQPKGYSPSWMRRMMMSAAKELLPERLPWELPAGPWAYQGEPGWNIPAGWTQCATPDCADVHGGPDFGVWSSLTSCSAQPACPLSQFGGVWPTTRLPWGTQHASRRDVLGYKWTSGNYTDATFKGTIVVQFVKVPGTTSMPTWSNPAAAPLPDLRPPLARPEPAVKTKAEPKHENKPRPYLPPYVDEADEMEPKPRTLVLTSPVVKTKPKLKLGPPGPPPPRTHWRRPDGKKKINMPKWLFVAMKLNHTASEIMDAVDCLHDALPASAKGGGHPTVGGVVYGPTPPAPITKVGDVLDNFEKIDWPKALLCLGYNHFEDKAVGGFFGALGKKFEAVGGPSTTQISQPGRSVGRMNRW